MDAPAKDLQDNAWLSWLEKLRLPHPEEIIASAIEIEDHHPIPNLGQKLVTEVAYSAEPLLALKSCQVALREGWPIDSEPQLMRRLIKLTGNSAYLSRLMHKRPSLVRQSIENDFHRKVLRSQL